MYIYIDTLYIIISMFIYIYICIIKKSHPTRQLTSFKICKALGDNQAAIRHMGSMSASSSTMARFGAEFTDIHIGCKEEILT